MRNFIETVEGIDLKLIYVESDTPFYMSEKCITVRQWAWVMQREESRSYKVDGQLLDRPVTGITYEQACVFCEKLGALTHRRYTLPTESGWEDARQWAEKNSSKRGKRRAFLETPLKTLFWEWCAYVGGEGNEYCPCHAYPVNGECNVCKHLPTYSADNLGFRIVMVM